MINTSAATYVLRVRGDSMVDAHIMDGDLVVIREQQTAQDGDIVVAQVEENAVTLKRFFKERTRVRLQPANDLYEPQYYDAVRDPGQARGSHQEGGLAPEAADFHDLSTPLVESRCGQAAEMIASDGGDGACVRPSRALNMSRA